MNLGQTIWSGVVICEIDISFLSIMYLFDAEWKGIVGQWSDRPNCNGMEVITRLNE